jgi:hypothetical protein
MGEYRIDDTGPMVRTLPQHPLQSWSLVTVSSEICPLPRDSVPQWEGDPQEGCVGSVDVRGISARAV